MEDPNPCGRDGMVIDEVGSLGFRLPNSPGRALESAPETAVEEDTQEEIEALGANTWLSCADRPGLAFWRAP